MIEYIKAIFPAEFKHNRAYWRAFVLGMVMLCLALAQLFTFEDFPALIEMMRMLGGTSMAWVLAIVLPLLELGSLPYLLSMRVNGKMRRISMWSGLVGSVLWLAITIWTSIKMGMSVESGIFGGTIATNSGWWSVLFSALLVWSYWLTMRELPRRRAS